MSDHIAWAEEWQPLKSWMKLSSMWVQWRIYFQPPRWIQALAELYCNSPELGSEDPILE